MGCHFLLQRIFLTQESNPGLPHCRQTLYRLSHQEAWARRTQHLAWYSKHCRHTIDTEFSGGHLAPPTPQ